MPYVKQRTRIQMHPRGMGQAGWFSDFLCSTGLLTPGSATCSAASTADSAALSTPTLAPGSVSPGLPTGYNPDTGLISDNTTGATETNPYSVDLTGYPVASGTDASGNPITNPWYCQYFGIGCPGETGTPTWMWAVGLTLGAVVLLNAFGRRR